MKIKVRRLTDNAVIPEYQSSGAAGFDLVSTEDVTLVPGETRLISTGLAFEIPEGYEMQIRPRSGLSFKTSMVVKNAPGTIDSDYRGEVKIIAHNLFRGPMYSSAMHIKAGDRIAQAVICPVVRVELDTVDELSDTDRNGNGFGSTGG